MKKLLYLILLISGNVSAQSFPDSTRQTSGISFTPQFNYKGANASTSTIQLYNPLNGKYFGIYSAYQADRKFAPLVGSGFAVLSGGNNFVNGLNTFEALGASNYAWVAYKNGTTTPLGGFGQVQSSGGGILVLRDHFAGVSTQINGDGTSSFTYPLTAVTFTNYGQAKYNAARTLSSLDFTYKQYNDSVYVHTNTSPYNVLNYGATADSTVDLYTALSAIQSILPASGGSIYIPAGRYKMLHEFVQTKPLHIYGDGYLFGQDSIPTVPKGLTKIYYSGTDSAAFKSASPGFIINDLAINYVGSYGSISGKHAIQLNNSPYAIIKDLSINNFDIGLKTITNSYYYYVNNVHFDNIRTYGIYADNVYQPDYGDQSITNCYFTPKDSSTISAAIYVHGGGGLRIANNKINAKYLSQQFKYGIYIDNPVPTNNLSLVNNSVENTRSSGVYQSTSSVFTHIVVNGNEFSILGSAPVIDLQGTLTASIVSGNTLYAPLVGTTPAIRFGSNVSYSEVGINNYEGSINALYYVNDAGTNNKIWDALTPSAIVSKDANGGFTAGRIITQPVPGQGQVGLELMGEPSFPGLNNIAQNAYYESGTWKYRQTGGYAGLINVNNGAFNFYGTTAPGTAGGPISFTNYFTVDNTGISIPGSISATGGLSNGMTATTQSAGDNSTKVATTAYVDGAISGQNIGADLTSQTSTTAIGTPSLSSDQTIRVGAYIIVNSVTTDVIRVRCSYTDIHNNLQTFDITPIGGTANISTTGDYSYQSFDIRAKSGTSPTIFTDLVTGTGSINYDLGATFTKLR